jgi:hypothetical protein
MCPWRFCAHFVVRPQLLTRVSALPWEGEPQSTPVPFNLVITRQEGAITATIKREVGITHLRCTMTGITPAPAPADCLRVRRESRQTGMVMMTEAILSASPHRCHASLVTERCAARRTVLPSGSRTWRAGERKDAMGNMVNPCKPREVERAKAADRL